MAETRLPPLVPDSDVARVLYRVWSGERISTWQREFFGQVSQMALAATIALHLSVRADYEVRIIGDSWTQHHAMPTELSEIAPWLPEPTFRGREAVIRPVPNRNGAILLEGPTVDQFPRVVDVNVVVHLGSDVKAEESMTAFAGGRQLLVVGNTWPFHQSGNRTDVDVPMDVMLAGGVEDPVD